MTPSMAASATVPKPLSAQPRRAANGGPRKRPAEAPTGWAWSPPRSK